MDMSDITMFITKMNEAFGLITEELSRVADALNELFECLGENEKEEKRKMRPFYAVCIFGI